MARNTELTKKRNEQILEMYDRLSSVKKGVVPIYSYEYIIEQIKDHFHLMPKTIIKIIKS